MPAPNPLLSRPLSEPDEAVLRAFSRRLLFLHKSPRTIQSYLEAARLLAGFLDGRVTLEDATTADIENSMIHMIDCHSATTASVRFKSLQQFYNWLTAEEWIARNPITGLRASNASRNPCRCSPNDDLRRLIAACQGKEFADRRDEAMIRLLSTPACGLRRCVALRSPILTCAPTK